MKMTIVREVYIYFFRNSFLVYAVDFFMTLSNIFKTSLLRNFSYRSVRDLTQLYF